VLYRFEKSCETWAEIEGDIVTIRYQKDLMPGYHVMIGRQEFEIISVRDILSPTRLVELGIRDIKRSGRRRFCPAGEWDEQQPPRAFPQAMSTRAISELEK
jgi:hypothetical protein